MDRKRTRPLTSSSVLLFLLVPSALAVEADFSLFPKVAQSCLISALTWSKCSGADTRALNACLCSNGGNFIISSSQCLGKWAKSELPAVYITMSEACANSSTPLSISQRAFFDAANARSKTTTSPSATSAETETSTSSDPSATTSSQAGTETEDTSSGISKGTIIAISVCAAAAGLAVIGGLVVFLVRKRKRRAECIAHPVLGQEDGDNHKTDNPTTFPPNEPLSGLSDLTSYKEHAWTSSPSPGYSNGNSQVKGTGPYAASPHELPPVWPDQSTSTLASTTRGPVFEMDATSAPARACYLAEMEGSQPPRRFELSCSR